MGATDFWTRAKGSTAAEAFKYAKAKMQHECGHGRYTGTLAEKTAFTVIAVPTGQDPTKYAQQLFEDADPRINDKWGPAGCVKLEEAETWLFFGWASE